MDRFIPKQEDTKDYVALRSSEDGNCLYSSASLLSNSSLKTVNVLRLLTSIELFEKASYYARYSLFVKQVENNNSNLSSVLVACVSFECSDQFKLINSESASEIIIMEALINCQANKFSSFLCQIALSSVLNIPIRSIYPDFG
nr:uncharacterized protein LOC124811378 [Hydra vulgaris]